MSIIVDILTGGTNNHQTTSESANGLATDFVSEGIVGALTNTSGVAPATGGFAANEADTPDMTVDVSAGVAYVSATPTSQGSQVLRVKSSATESVVIAANSSGSTKYDWIYIKIDASTAADPNSGATDVATLVTSRSTSSSSDDGTPPTYGYPIAVVTVSNGASSIVDANIADVREQITFVEDGTITNAKLSTATGEIGAAWTAFTPSWVGFSGTPTVTVARYKQIGKTVHVWVDVTGTSNSTSTSFTLPVAANATTSVHSVAFRYRNNGTISSTPGMLVASGSTATLYRDFTATTWTSSGTKTIYPIQFVYEAA